MPATFTFPNRIVFGAGVRTLLAEELARLGVAHLPDYPGASEDWRGGTDLACSFPGGVGRGDAAAVPAQRPGGGLGP